MPQRTDNSYYSFLPDHNLHKSLDFKVHVDLYYCSFHDNSNLDVEVIQLWLFAVF